MYEFWYGYLKPKYGDKIKLWYTDTDSFVIEVKTEDLYVDISADVKNGLILLIIRKMIINIYQQE